MPLKAGAGHSARSRHLRASGRTVCARCCVLEHRRQAHRGVPDVAAIGNSPGPAKRATEEAPHGQVPAFEIRTCDPLGQDGNSKPGTRRVDDGLGQRQPQKIEQGINRAVVNESETGELFARLAYSEDAARGVLVLEGRTLPDEAVAAWVAAKAGVPAHALTVAIAPTASVAGGVQIVARILETGLHKMDALGFDVTAFAMIRLHIGLSA